MDNQYNYYNPNSNYQYGGPQPGGQNGEQPEKKPNKEKKSHKNLMRAAAVTGFAILFGVVSSGVFLATNVVGERLLGLRSSDEAAAASSDKISSGTSLSTSSSVVTSDVSKVVEKVMP